MNMFKIKLFYRMNTELVIVIVIYIQIVQIKKILFTYLFSIIYSMLV